MKYTREERLEIGKQIYTGEMSQYEAAQKYTISEYTARDYMRLYRDENGLPPRKFRRSGGQAVTAMRPASPAPGKDEYEAMTKEDLIRELMRSRIREARLKKGYMVKGDGLEKEYVLLDIRNTK